MWHLCWSRCCKKTSSRNVLQFSHVMQLRVQEKVLAHCIKRNDDWSAKIQSRLLSIHDLQAGEALYHHECNANLCTGKNIPTLFRPKSTCKMMAFQIAIKYLEENDDETITLDNLYIVMKERSARTGNWLLYLESLHEMLPYLAASGHNNYTSRCGGDSQRLHTSQTEAWCQRFIINPGLSSRMKAILHNHKRA